MICDPIESMMYEISGLVAPLQQQMIETLPQENLSTSAKQVKKFPFVICIGLCHFLDDKILWKNFLNLSVGD